MTTEEMNEYFNIYENYIKELIRLNADNPDRYRCTARRIEAQGDSYVLGGLWPRCNTDSEECERWPRMPNLDNERDGIVYLHCCEGDYVINAFLPKWEGNVMIIRYSRYEV